MRETAPLPRDMTCGRLASFFLVSSYKSLVEWCFCGGLWATLSLSSLGFWSRFLHWPRSYKAIAMQLKLASLVLFSLLVAASPAPAPKEPIARIPVARRSFTKDGVADIDALKEHLANVRLYVSPVFLLFPRLICVPVISEINEQKNCTRLCQLPEQHGFTAPERQWRFEETCS